MAKLKKLMTLVLETPMGVITSTENPVNEEEIQKMEEDAVELSSLAFMSLETAEGQAYIPNKLLKKSILIIKIREA